MKKLNLLLLVAIMFFACSCGHAQTKVKETENIKSTQKMNYNKLTPEEERVILGHIVSLRRKTNPAFGYI